MFPLSAALAPSVSWPTKSRFPNHDTEMPDNLSKPCGPACASLPLLVAFLDHS